MEACVFDSDGKLDKFLGDGVMATFGTPEPGPSDPANALACARAMHAAVDEWNGRRRDAGLPPIRLSVGVHWGRVVLGDIGSERRLEFTVLGDTVNVAARIEALTRMRDCRVAVSEALVNVLRTSGDPRAGTLLDGFHDAGRQITLGRAEPVAVWTWGTPVAPIPS
ncbi:MAG: adenylate/guanylate cyclase domain-containing protein [Alphaproteobacteria bacterium]|nr:adenylate/guanylate cyclase domain-containing protein [Alphaproteobacteria bacterium]